MLGRKLWGREVFSSNNHIIEWLLHCLKIIVQELNTYVVSDLHFEYVQCY